MPYLPALWDGSDPLYAPGLVRTKRWFYWKPPAKYVKAGYVIRNVRLPGEDGDGRDAERALRCRELTQDMLTWYESPQIKVEPGTWKWLIARYKSDEFSPYRDVKSNTRESYDYNIARWEESIGHLPLEEADHVQLMRWRAAMQAKGRSVSYIARMFRVLRIVVNYGAATGNKEAERIAGILSRVRIPAARPRSIAPTRAQIYAVIAAADAAGQTAFATGLMIQFEFALRAVDVRGQWLDAKAGETGIIRHGKRWQDGLTWGMIDRDVTRITKTPSKTERHMEDEMVFDLTLVPELRARLQAIPPAERIGPVIKSRSGQPYARNVWARMFRRHAMTAGLPDDILLMDTRAGAITEARLAGANPYDLRDAAGHKLLATTDRYARARNEAVSNVVKIRQVGTKSKPA
ncbi:tyrosine-type recombinase/integrase [Halodurantibacterium flavum]|uniref:Tyrosine-type recombinase/integrase n=1 Tax=Halodurantibacterium flavum TaxID=1382802 RepID=A0ABW4SB40_9RHOB